MKTHIYSDETIGQYLLGGLSEEETERLDELSIADDEFAGRLNALENDLVDAYVRGELEGQRLERFNSFYLSSPRRTERARFAKAFQNVADRTVVAAEMGNRQRSFSEGATGEKRAIAPQRLKRFFFFPGPVLQWAALAALLVVAVGLVAVNLRLRNQMNTAQTERAELEQRDRELRSQLAQERSSASQQEKEIEGLRDKVAQLEQRASEIRPSPLASEAGNFESFVLSPQTRSVGQIPTLSIPSGTDVVFLQLELEAGDYPSYRAELKSTSDRRVAVRSWRLRAKTKDDRRVIEVGIRPSVLKSQNYILEVTGVSTDGAREPVGSYPFRVEKQ